MHALRRGEQSAHVTNTCPAFDALRKNAWKKLNKLTKPIIKVEDRYNGDLEKAFLDAYFKPKFYCDKELEVLKSFAISWRLLIRRLI